MAYHNEIVVDWCIEARVKGKGKPHRHETMGIAADAVPAMVAWLRTVEADMPADATPKIEIVAMRTSEQVPGAERKTTMDDSGFPTPLAFNYAIDQLERVGEGDTWSSGP